MNATPFNVGAFVMGAPTSPRALVRHADLLAAYADGAIEDEREAYLSHFVFGPEMIAHYRANRNSVAEYAGPCGCRRLVLDIDRPDLVDALADARRLVTAIHERYPEMEGDVPVYFSGGKGFHVLLELAHSPPPAVGFQHVAKAFAVALAARAGVKIDAGIYDVNHLVRLPNTKHPKSGLFKRRIDSEALFALDVPRILDMAKHPAGDGIPTVRTPPTRLAEDWRDAERETARAADARAAVRRDFGDADARAPRYFLDFLRFGVDEGERHPTLFRSAAWLTEQGSPPSLVAALLTEPGCDNGLSPKDVARQIQCGIDHARKQRGRRPTRRPTRTRRRTRRPTPTPASAGRSGTRPTRSRPARCSSHSGRTADPTGPKGADDDADVHHRRGPARLVVRRRGARRTARCGSTLPAPFAALDVRPGRLILFGGAPGGGKTAALLQIGIDLLRRNESARLVSGERGNVAGLATWSAWRRACRPCRSPRSPTGR